MFTFKVIGDNSNCRVEDENFDVEIEISGEVYVATFFTLRNIEYLMKHYETTGECGQGSYFWATDMIVVKSIKDASIEAVIKDLITSGEYKTAFSKVNSSV